MPDKKIILRQLTPAVGDAASKMLAKLSPADRRELQELFNAIPTEAGLMRLLLKQASSGFRSAFGNKHRVAIVGPTNTGKSTLYNQLVPNKEDRAEVSPLPGTTRENQTADAGLFNVVDTPGADAVGQAGDREKELALQAAADADFLIILFDAIQGVKRTEQELFEQLTALGKPYVVALNKIDLVRRDEQKVIEGAAASLGIDPALVLPVVARTGQHLDDILAAIAVSEPELIAALGQALPRYRSQLAWRAIVSAASASAVIALTPLPVFDFIPLTITQTVMVVSIARIYNYKISVARARELLITFGIGFLGRTLFQQLSKVAGVPGIALSAAVAASTTTVMGYAASQWFATGERVSRETLNRLNKEVGSIMLDAFKNIGKRKPNKETIRQRVEQALEDTPIAPDEGQ